MTEMTKQKIATKDLTYMALMVALMAVCAWISIPAAVPFTMQTFAVFVAIGLLGMKRGTLATLVYVLLGAVGVPVFAGFSGGPAAVVGPTGGYIIGFVMSALVGGFMIDRFGKKVPMLAISMIIGLLVCYAFGTAWFVVVYSKANGPVGVATALAWCVIPYIIPDCIKIALAILVTKRVGKWIN